MSRASRDGLTASPGQSFDTPNVQPNVPPRSVVVVAYEPYSTPVMRGDASLDRAGPMRGATLVWAVVLLCGSGCVPHAPRPSPVTEVEPTPASSVDATVTTTGGPPPAPPVETAVPPAKTRDYLLMLGAGECEPVSERRAVKPPYFGHRNCALYRGCPAVPRAKRLQPCPGDLPIVGIRDLRSENGARVVGSSIAVRGWAKIGTSLSSAPPAEGYPHGRCEPWTHRFLLSAEDEGTCLSVALDTTDSLRCHGDRTDLCCAATPARPKQGDIAVAVGTYAGVGRVFSDGEGDAVTVDHFCSLPTPRRAPP